MQLTSPFDMPDCWCVMVYTAADNPWLLASPKARRLILLISSRCCTMGDFFRIFARWSRCPCSPWAALGPMVFASHMLFCKEFCVFPSNWWVLTILGDRNPRGSRSVTISIAAGKMTWIVWRVLFHGTPSNLVSPPFTPNWSLGCVWFSLSVEFRCSSVVPSREGTLDCHLWSSNVLFLKIDWEVCF